MVDIPVTRQLLVERIGGLESLWCKQWKEFSKHAGLVDVEKLVIDTSSLLTSENKPELPSIQEMLKKL